MCLLMPKKKKPQDLEFVMHFCTEAQITRSCSSHSPCALPSSPHAYSVWHLSWATLLLDWFHLSHLRKQNWYKTCATESVNNVSLHLSSFSWLTGHSDEELVWGEKRIGPHDLEALVVGPSLLVSLNGLVRIAVAVKLVVGCSGPAAFPPSAAWFITIFTLIFVEPVFCVSKVLSWQKMK